MGEKDFINSWVASTSKSCISFGLFSGGINKFIGFHLAIEEQASFGLQPAWLWAATAIVIEIVGSLLVIFNRFVWLGAGALGCLTAIAMLVANDFWNHTGPAFFSTFNSFFEHLGFIAALVMVTILSNQKRSNNKLYHPK
ncbi:DoxX family protein [Acinetobacter calcoaceticus]|uniref:DoxX family protein n=1 Tax=Acinetobacter calcoaceticus TaxID=471 RepID=UPI000A9DC2FF|nr:DoxX family protein [Acinetobacter calcoaceticus]